MKILVTGGKGLVGSALLPFLRTGGHDVINLTRGQVEKSCCDYHWNPGKQELDPAALDGVEAVVHLAGENIAGGRWTQTKKAKIRDSRVQGTRFLSQKLAGHDRPPKVFVCASAIGFYGDLGQEVLTEDSPPGNSFLSEVCKEWEAATQPAVEKGIRVVNLRIGVVLTPKGGALAKMLTPFKLGVGGVMGSGEQYWSWISIDDVVGAIHHAIMTESLSGPVNAVAPNPVTNREFTKALGRVLSRPTVFPMPAFAARAALGEMADELLLASTRVQSAKLNASGYAFRYSNLEEALRHVLGK
ncbi:MAG: TIGR01777 family oxidoreductase [bacterium]